MGVPTLQVFGPSAEIYAAPYPVWFVVADPDSQLADVVCEYSFNGQPFQVATPAPISDRLSAVPAPYIGADYRFLWDAVTDLGLEQQGSAVIRMTPSVAGVPGAAAVTASFNVNTRSSWLPPVDAAPAFVELDPLPLSLYPIYPTSLAKGLSGLLFEETFTATTSLGGVKISFTIVPDPGASNPLAEIDDEGLSLTTTTHSSGNVGVRIRGLPGATGTGKLQARIVGVPDGTPNSLVEFPIQVDAPVLTFGSAPVTTIAYGQENLVDFELGPNPYQLDPRWPLEFNFQATGLTISRTKFRASYFWSPGMTIAVTPTILEGNATLTVTCTDPTVTVPPPIPFTVQKANPVQRTTDLSGGTEPVYLMLKRISGLAAGDAPPVAYPGLTLAQPLKVQLTDANGIPYAAASAPTWPCNTVPPPAPLTFYFHASGGTLSFSQGPGTSADLPVQSTLDGTDHPAVYFTPTGIGPWTVDVSGGGNLVDPQAVQLNGLDANGNPMCSIFALQGSGSCRFYFQSPTDASLRNFTTGKEIPFRDLKPGVHARFQIDGVADTVAGDPGQVKLDTLSQNGFQTRGVSPFPAYVPGGYGFVDYSGITYGFESYVSLTPRNSGPLVSDDFLLAQGDAPEITAPIPTHVHLLLPGGLFRVCQPDFCVNAIFPLRSRHSRRRFSGPAEAIQECRVGTTPRGGGRNTVSLRTGEFIYGACDLEYGTRGGVFGFRRIYHSQLDSDGPLGPGWSFEHGQFFDTARMTWHNGSGHMCVYGWPDQTPFMPDKGVFDLITYTQAVTNDESAWVIADPHQNQIHFNYDGSVKFLRDRNNNRTTYVYNEKAQLIRVVDPLGQTQPAHCLTLTYWPDADATSSALDQGRSGKLKSIADFTGRTVQYDYDAQGRLQTVTLPAAPTIRDGAAADPGSNLHLDPAFSRSEGYAYDGNDQMLSISRDGAATPILSNQYDGNARVFQQAFNGGQFNFSYPDALTTRVVDRNQRTTEYTFPISPYPDGAAPTSFLDETGKNRWLYVHNYDGNRIKVVEPTGKITCYIYDDRAAYFATLPGGWGGLYEDRHGNLLAVREVGADGDERIWWYQYESEYNFPSYVVPPEGNAPGACPGLAAFTYLYDYQVATPPTDPTLQPGNSGNLVLVSGPPSLHALVQPDASGVNQSVWLIDVQRHTRKYNSFGRCVWYQDPAGVVTQYAYYQEAQPGGGAADANGGGFLASETRDAEASDLRKLYLPSINVTPVATQWTYDDLGRIQTCTNPAGKNTTVEASPLNEITSVTIPTSAPIGQQPASAEVNFGYSTFGLRRQAQASDGSGGTWAHEENTDAAGNATDIFATVQPGAFTHAQLKRDPNDVVTGRFPPDVLAAGTGDPGGPPFTEAGTTSVPDERGWSGTINEGVPMAGTTSDPPLVTTYGWGADQALQSAQAPGADHPTTLLQDAYGNTDRLIDPKGNVTTIGYDESGRADRSTLQLGEGGSNETARSDTPDFDAAPLLALSENRRDELGRLRRIHTACFIPGPGGTPLPVVADHFHQRQWTLRPALPTARRRAACGVVNGTLYVAGGYHQTALTVVEALDLTRNTWTTKAVLPTATATAGAVVNGILYLIGGTGTTGATDAVQAYDPAADAWISKAAMLAPRSDHALVACNNLIYAIGGTESGGTVSARLEAYDPAAVHWTTLAALPTPRTAVAACVANGQIVAIGGVAGGATVTTVEWFDPVAGTWSTGTPLPAGVRFPAVAALGNMLYVAGGFADATSEKPAGGNIGFALSIPAGGAATWSPQAPMLTPQANTAFTTDSGRLYVAGSDNQGQDLATVEVFNPLAAPWPPRAGVLLPDGPLGPGDGRITQDIAYDVRGLPVKIVDDRMGYTHILRDAHDRPIAIDWWSAASPAQLMTTINPIYDDTTGLLLEVRITERPTAGAIADPTNNTPAQAKVFRYKLDYDDLGRVTRVIDGEGNASRVEYDSVGFMYVAYNANGPDSKELFDLTSGPVINSDGDATRFTPKGAMLADVVTSLATLVDLNGIRATDPTLNSFNSSGAVGLHFTYSDGGQLLAFQGQEADPSGYRTTMRYDPKGRLTGIYHPPSAALPLSAPTLTAPNGEPQPSLKIDLYDLFRGGVELVSDANGSQLHFKYDDTRVTGMTVDKFGAGVGGSAQLKFDYQGSDITLTDVTTGRVCKQTFDSQQNAINEVQGAWTVVHSNNGNGLRTLQYPGNAGATLKVTYGFDTAGRLLYVTDGGSTLAEFEYLGAHRVINRSLWPTKVTYTYSDGVGRLVGMRVDGLANAASIVYTLKRDRMGRLLQRSRVLAGVTETKNWTYDSAGRIVIEAAQPALRTPNVITTTRYYDGDTVLRIQKVVNGTVQTMTQTQREERGRIVKRNGLALTYDRNGNLSIDDAGHAYSYDAWNRLIGVTAGAVQITYQYDALNRCVLKTWGTTAEEYIYDNHELIQVRVNGAMAERFVYGDQLDDVLQLQVGAQTYIVLHGPEGWIEGLLDQLGNIAELYDYSLSGEVTVLDGKGMPKPANTRPISRLLFQKQAYDADIGLYRYRSRWYDPRLGQFLTPNPLGHKDGANYYVLNQGDPVNLTAQFGLESAPQYATEIGVEIPLFARKQISGLGADIHTAQIKYELASLAIGFDAETWAENCNLPAWVARLYVDQVSRLRDVAMALNGEIERRDSPGLVPDDPVQRAWRERQVQAMEEYEMRHEAVLTAWEASWDLFNAAGGLLLASMEPSTTPGRSSQRVMARRGSRPQWRSGRGGSRGRRAGAIGREGEALAKRLVAKLPNVKRVLWLQNKCGHGLDLVIQYENGTWEPFEVKTSTTSEAPPTSVLQGDAASFLIDVLERVMDRDGIVMKHRGGIRTSWDADQVKLAKEIFEDIYFTQQPVYGRVIEVTNLGTPQEQVTMRPWEQETGVARVR